MGGETVAFEAAHVAVQLYYGNVTVQHADAAELRSAAEAYGPVETAFIVHNPAGVTKVRPMAVLVACQPSGVVSIPCWHLQVILLGICLNAMHCFQMPFTLSTLELACMSACCELHCRCMTGSFACRITASWSSHCPSLQQHARKRTRRATAASESQLPAAPQQRQHPRRPPSTASRRRRRREPRRPK